MYTEFKNELKNKNIKISFNNGKLKYSGPKEVIDKELISKLEKYKQNLIKEYWPKECCNIVPLNTKGNKTPLVLIHMGNYAELEVEVDRPVYVIYYLGSETEKKSYKTVKKFTDVYISQLLKIIPEGPYHLGGMSFGGVIAYEIAIRLIKMGHKVHSLTIGDLSLLKKNKKNKYFNVYETIYRPNTNIFRTIYHTCGYLYKTKRKELFPSAYLNLDGQKRADFIERTYYNALKKHNPTTPYKGKILLFISQYNHQRNPNYLGWDKICKDISVIPFNATHYAMFEDEKTSNFILSYIIKWINENEETEILSEY